MRLPLALSLACLLAACGGGDSSSSNSARLAPPDASLVRVSQASPYAAGCGGGMQGSVSYEDAEVEPYVAINPTNSSNLIGVWQQDRWSDGGAHGLVVSSSMDGGKHWKEQPLVMSVCAGGDAGNNADYARASDPWVSFAPDGTAYVISISFSGDTLAPGSLSGVLVSRSADGGTTWSKATALIKDGAGAFNDKESITADPNDSHYVYAVWDRLTSNDHGATEFARSTDGGMSWEPAVSIYDPGVDDQTIGNEVVGLPDGTILDLFEEIDNTSSDSSEALVRVIRSSDHGSTWSKPVTVAANLSVGTFDPDTGNLVRAGSGLPQMTATASGELVAVWQDGRFSGGKYDGIALSRSKDDGQTWTTPVRVNAMAGAPAFTPSVAALKDGTLGVTYFDFRNNTPDPSTLATDYWFVSSTDGSHWSEQHISGPFDLDLAPEAEGLFLGDYQALSVIGDAFVPFFVQTNDDGTADRSDSYVLPPQAVPLHVTHTVSLVTLEQTPVQPGIVFRQKLHANHMQLLRGENPGWDALRSARRAAQSAPP